MTELGFLLELLLNHKLSKATKALIASRIQEVEARGVQQTVQPSYRQQPQAAQGVQSLQSPSTIAAMQRHGLLPEEQAQAEVAGGGAPPPTPPAVIAQTPAAMAAVADRQAIIQQAMSGKPTGGQSSPYKMRGQLK